MIGNSLPNVRWPEIRQSEVNGGYCYVCGNYSDRLRRVCIHNNQDMLICWVCELCDVQPTSATIYRMKG